MRIDRRSFLTGAVAIIAGSAVACATASGGAGTASRNLVTGEELTGTNTRNVYEALQRLRPSWMSSRGPVSMTNSAEAVAQVYINGSHMGDLEYLKQISITDVHEVRYWEAGEASARFGMGNPRGVIEIIPRR